MDLDKGPEADAAAAWTVLRIGGFRPNVHRRPTLHVHLGRDVDRHTPKTVTPSTARSVKVMLKGPRSERTRQL